MMCMKTSVSLLRRLLFISSMLLATGILFSACDKDNDDDNNNANYTISGNASGSQMVPAVTGNGTGTISGNYNPNTRVLTYTTNWSNLSGAPTSGGFFTGASGSAGTAVGSSWTMGSGLTGTGTYSGTMTLTDAQATQLTGGNWYYSLGTANNTGGEIRGQITATRQ
jgi:hypothetical protein